MKKTMLVKSRLHPSAFSLMMKTLKAVCSVILLGFLLTSSSGCSKKDSDTKDDTGKTGTFTIDGVSYKGTTSILTIGGVYSVSCQQDEPFKLIQVHFGSKEEAEKGGEFAIRDFGIDDIKGEVEVGVDGLTFDPDGSYTVSVKDKKIVMKNVKLIQTGQGSKKPVINECSIEF